MSIVSPKNILYQVLQNPFDTFCGEFRFLKLGPGTLLAPLSKNPHKHLALRFARLSVHVAQDFYLGRTPTSVAQGTPEPAGRKKKPIVSSADCWPQGKCS
jgi:hypothetical protein